MDRTEVCITIDTEFSIAGTFGDPERRQPLGDRLVYGPSPRGEEGLGFLLDCFARHGTRATFFVEPLNHFHFGDEPMRRVTQRILAAGQDVQLHTHPVWLTFRSPRWKEELKERKPNDSFVGRPRAEVVECLGIGLDALERWGAPRPVALRTGSLRADRALYEAMSGAGLSLSSNLGVGYHAPPEDELQLRGGRHRVGDVCEVPVLTYRAWGRERILTVTGTGRGETEALLWAARRAGISPVVVLTHPFEFFKKRDPGYQVLRRNRVNQGRLDHLCAFLAAHPQDFGSATFGADGPRWRALPPTGNPSLAVPATAPVPRLFANKLNDLLWWF